jgi:ABC-type transport system substrate-binding protein
VYRVGVLSNVTAANFWAFYGSSKPSVWDAYILGPTRSSLYTFDASTGALVSQLAEGEVVPRVDNEGWYVDVPLRDDFAWSDGEPMTAHDVVFTFETARAFGLGGSWSEVFPDEVDTLVAKEDFLLQVRFSDKPTLAVWPHGPGLAPIMARHVWEGAVTDETTDTLYMNDLDDVYGGLLQLKRVDEELTISEANRNHPDSIAVDVVEYHVFADEANAVDAVVDGVIDTFLNPKGIAEELLIGAESSSGVTVASSFANGIRYLGFNLTRQPMSKPAFRTALALLLDRESMTGTVAHSYISPSNSRWFDAEAAARNEERLGGDLSSRLDEALEGLRAEGFSWVKEPTISDDGTIVAGEGLAIDGVEVQPLTILTPGDAYDPARPDHAASIAETLGWLGFEARPVETDFDTVVDLAFTADEDGRIHYDMYLLGWTLGSPALPAHYRPLFAADGVMNNTGYDSEVFDAHLDAYEQAVDIEAARTALWDMEMTLNKDLPYLLLYPSEILEIYRSDRVAYGANTALGGIQGRLGGIGDVTPAG